MAAAQQLRVGAQRPRERHLRQPAQQLHGLEFEFDCVVVVVVVVVGWWWRCHRRRHLRRLPPQVYVTCCCCCCCCLPPPPPLLVLLPLLLPPPPLLLPSLLLPPPPPPPPLLLLLLLLPQVLAQDIAQHVQVPPLLVRRREVARDLGARASRACCSHASSFTASASAATSSGRRFLAPVACSHTAASAAFFA